MLPPHCNTRHELTQQNTVPQWASWHLQKVTLETANESKCSMVLCVTCHLRTWVTVNVLSNNPIYSAILTEGNKHLNSNVEIMAYACIDIKFL